MKKNRIYLFGLLLIFVFILLASRLSYIALQDDYLSINKINNQIIRQTIIYPRGRIVDRNFISFTGNINQDLQMYDSISSYNVGETVIGSINVEKANTTNQCIKGINGIQELYDTKLNGGLPIKVVEMIDGQGKEINKFIYGDHINQGNTIQLTLDYNIQKAIESIISQENKQKGIAVVLMDIKSGDILTMASVGNEMNKTVQSFNPGSVFKILVSLVALQEGVVSLEEEFECLGDIEIDGQIKHCHKEEGHGTLNFKEAFAQSCNIVFYEVASRLNIYNENGELIDNKLLNFSRTFGFQREKEVEHKEEFILSYKNEYSTIPNKVYNNLDIFNLALGQGVTETSPLLMTKIVSTIANNGVMCEPRLIMSEMDSEENLIKYYDIKKNTIIPISINSQLKILLEEVCVSGTARHNDFLKYGGIAGKTGTAERESNPYCYTWFSGYFPVKEPIYAMTVFVEDGESSSKDALPIFINIAKEIYELYPW